MNTNNKEAIELLRIAEDEIKEGYTFGPQKLIGKAIDLLQDNEDTEIQEEPLLQNNPGHEHLPSGIGKGAYCVGCLEELDKPSSKVEKLKELQEEIGGGGYGKDYIHPMCDLIDILLIEGEE